MCAVVTAVIYIKYQAFIVCTFTIFIQFVFHEYSFEILNVQFFTFIDNLKITQRLDLFKLRDKITERFYRCSGPKKIPLPSGSRKIPLPNDFTLKPPRQTHPRLFNVFISLTPKPIFCNSGPRTLPSIGIFPAKSDTTTDPDFNCSSIAQLCLACSAFDLVAETALDIPPAKPPAAPRALAIIGINANNGRKPPFFSICLSCLSDRFN